MFRLFFTVKALWLHWRELKEYPKNLSLQTKTIFDCNLSAIKQSGIKVLVLDYDNVLAGHAVNILDEKVISFLNKSMAIFGSDHVFILSNRPTEVRYRYFEKTHPGLRFVSGFRKKPYPDSLLWIMKETKVSAEEVLVVDDRLFTGILAAILVGSRALWVTSPMVRLDKHPILETIYIVLRYLELGLLKL